MFGVLQNFDNSCYMDSIIYILLFPKNKFIKNMLNKKLKNNSFIEIQNELINLQKGIMCGEKNKCIKFRNLLSKINLNQFETFSDKEMKDADEFLKFIFFIFEENNETIRQDTYGIGKVKKKSKSFNIKSSPIFDINVNILKKFNILTIEQLLNYEDKIFLEIPLQISKKNYYTIIQSVYPYKFDYMVVNVQRNFLGKFIETKIIPNKAFKIGNKILKLGGIVIWKNQHYTSIIRYNKIFLYFDDLEINLIKIGNYKDLLIFKKKQILSNGVLYFYF